MKNIQLVLKLNLILFLLSSTFSFAQNQDIDVPFVVLEDIPQFDNCEITSGKEAKDCFFQMMNNHIISNFRYPKQAVKKNIQGRVTVLFVIDKNGDITNIKTHAPEGCQLLEIEAVRIIKLLPKFKPAIQRGEAVGVSYAQPINFKLN
ncbi:energy transducer TonB [Flavobacterium gelidilacus]|uniref:energy transducer TonB n=1 Tax=Flavobacterium gelidilacus TaxID=206041 RepID=UPI00040676D2|nr:energy transducer TonB [Flavobacterium gelidilacus]